MATAILGSLAAVVGATGSSSSCCMAGEHGIESEPVASRSLSKCVVNVGILTHVAQARHAAVDTRPPRHTVLAARFCVSSARALLYARP